MVRHWKSTLDAIDNQRPSPIKDLIIEQSKHLIEHEKQDVRNSMKWRGKNLCQKIEYNKKESLS